jgi:hypothetical protein
VLSSNRSRSWLIAAAGAGVLLTAGCSSASSGHQASADRPLSAGQAIQLAAAHARLATSFDGTMSMRTSGTDTVTIAGTISEAFQPALVFAADFPTVTADGMSVNGGMTEILDGNALYLRMSTLSSVTGGKPWVKVPLSELSGTGLTQELQEAQQDNPLLQTQVLAGATHVRTAGTSTIAGVPVTEYTGSYSVAAALAKLPASARATEQKAAASYGFSTASFQIWLDNQQQVRKVIVTEPGTKEAVTVSMTVTSVNQPVTVQLPPAAQVATIPASELK